MTRRIVFLPPAQADIEEAADWYERRGPGLGLDFIRRVDRAASLIADHPFSYRRVQEEVRRAPLEKFPYRLVYEVIGDEVVVWACTHVRQDSEYWQRRRR